MGEGGSGGVKVRYIPSSVGRFAPGAPVGTADGDMAQFILGQSKVEPREKIIIRIWVADGYPVRYRHDTFCLSTCVIITPGQTRFAVNTFFRFPSSPVRVMTRTVIYIDRYIETSATAHVPIERSEFFLFFFS